MNKLWFAMFALALVARAMAAPGDLLTSAGRDLSFQVYASGVFANNYTPGGWHYEAKYSNGTIAPLIYVPQVGDTHWVDSVLYGNGYVRNASAYAGPGVSLIIDPGIITGGRPTYNTTISWVSNWTGNTTISGWHNVTKLFGTGSNYNLSFWRNGELLNWSKYQNILGVNTTYNVQTFLTYGDNLSISISWLALGDQPHLNITAFIQQELVNPDYVQVNISTPLNNSVFSDIIELAVNYSILSGGTIVNASIWDNTTGWLPIGSNKTIVTNTTWNLINATLATQGVHTFAVQVCTATVCAFSRNQTFNFTQARLRIQVLNETTTPTNMQFNLTISNGSNTTIFPAVTSVWFNLTRAELPTGDLRITIGNTSFGMGTRNFYLPFNYSSVNLTAYLLVSSISSELDLTLKDYAGNLLDGHYINIQRSFFGTDNWTTVAQVKTDYAGLGVAYVDATATFRFVVYNPSYQSIWTVSPVILDASLLIATNTYGRTIIVGQQSSGIIGQGLTTQATCSFDTGASLLTCNVAGYGASSNLTVDNSTALGFQQICSASSTPAEGVLYCSIPGYNGSVFRYNVYVTNPDGSRYLTASGLLDYSFTNLNWGLIGFIAFIFLVLTAAKPAHGDSAGIIVLTSFAAVLGKVLGVFNVGWEYLIALLVISFFLVKY